MLNMWNIYKCNQMRTNNPSPLIGYPTGMMVESTLHMGGLPWSCMNLFSMCLASFLLLNTILISRRKKP